MPTTEEKTQATNLNEQEVKEEKKDERAVDASKFFNFERAKRKEVKSDKSESAKEEKSEEKKDKAEEKKELKAEEKKTEKAEEKVEKKEEKKEPKATLKPVVKKDVDLEKLVKSTVESTAKAMKAEPKEEKKDEPKPDVPKRRLAEWENIVRAEKAGATRKGASEEAAELFRSEDNYIREWEKNNPGKRFNAKSAEHDDWYERNLPEWVEEATESGANVAQQDQLESKLLSKLEKEKLSPLLAKLEAAELRETTRSVDSEAPQHVAGAIGAAIQAINPELLKEGVKIEEFDPIAHEVLTKFGPEIAHETREALLLFATEGRTYKKSALHDRILNTAEKLEADISERSSEEKTDPKGRTFVTRAEWNSMNESVREQHWIVTGPLVAMKLASEQAEKAKQLYDSETSKLEKLAKARGWRMDKVSNGTENGHVEKEEEQEETEDKPRSPSAPSTTVIKPGARTDAKVTKDGTDKMVERMFSR